LPASLAPEQQGEHNSQWAFSADLVAHLPGKLRALPMALYMLPGKRGINEGNYA
jgi:hypothetical protein